MNTLVVFHGGYGDSFLMLPCLRELVRRIGSERIHLFCPADHLSVFFGQLHIDPIPMFSGPSAVSADILGDVDVHQVVSFNVYYPCPMDRLVAEKYPAAIWHGFFDRSGELMVRPSALVNLHKRDQYFEVLGFERNYDLIDRQVFLSPQSLQKMWVVCKELRPTEGRRFYTLHLDTQDIKMWPTEYWVDVVRHLWDRWRAWPIVLGKPSASSDELTRRCSFVQTMFAESNMVDQFAAICLATAFLGVDSLFAHVADSMNIPSIILFGPFDLTVWGPVGRASSALQMRHPGTLQEIRPAVVVESVVSNLGRVFT